MSDRRYAWLTQGLAQDQRLCPTCGCVVKDVERHDEWHESLTIRFADQVGLARLVREGEQKLRARA